MKKLLLLLCGLLVSITFAMDWYTLRDAYLLSGSDSITTLIPYSQGKEQVYFWHKIAPVTSSSPDVKVLWEYSPDNVTWYNYAEYNTPKSFAGTPQRMDTIAKTATLRPLTDNAAAWLRSTGADNYALVDEASASDLDYVYSGADTSAWDDFYIGIKIGATLYKVKKTLTTSFANYTNVWTTNPATTTAWTKAVIDAALPAVRLDATNISDIYTMDTLLKIPADAVINSVTITARAKMTSDADSCIYFMSHLYATVAYDTFKWYYTPNVLQPSLSSATWTKDSLYNLFSAAKPTRAYPYLRIKTICNSTDSGRYYLKSAVVK